MSPLFQLVLFNFLFRWPPLFGRTFYSTTGFIQQLFSYSPYSNWFYSTFYSDGRPYLVTVFIQQLNNCFIQLLILFNFLFRWPPLFGRTFYSTFYFIQLEWPPLFGHPYLFPALLQLIYLFFFSFFFLWKKRCLRWDSNPGPLDLQSGTLPLDHLRPHHHHNFKAVIKLITTPLIWSFNF